MDRTLIIGGGIAGVATAYFLARGGARSVTLLEKEIQLGQHSSGLNAAILRTWTPDPVLTRIALESARFLVGPPAGFSDVPLVDPCGLIVATRLALDEISSVYRGVPARDVPPVVELTPVRARELAPHFEPREGRLVHFPSEGRLDIAALLDGFARGARSHGTTIETGAQVSELVVESGAIRGARLSDGRELSAERVVLAAGGWAAKLGATAGSTVRLRPTRRHLCVTGVDRTIDPTWPIVWSDAEEFYARPESGGLLLCACDQTDVDPDRFRDDPTVLEKVAEKTARLLPAYADAEAAHFWGGVRTLTTDGRFAVGPDPDLAGLFWVAGLGGHGMTSAAAVGRIAATLITGGPVDAGLRSALAPSRFALALEG